MARRNQTKTRPSHKRPLTWSIIDLERFNALREDLTIPQDLRLHEGRLLAAHDVELIAARAYGAYTDAQARLFAANGSSGSQMHFLLTHGETRKSTYISDVRYVAVENAVLAFWKTEMKINWDPTVARQELYRREGEKILSLLSAEFIPPSLSPERNVQLTLDFRVSQKAPRADPTKPVPWRRRREPSLAR